MALSVAQENPISVCLSNNKFSKALIYLSHQKSEHFSLVVFTIEGNNNFRNKAKCSYFYCLINVLLVPRE